MVDTTTLTNLGPRNFMRLHPLVTMSVAIVRHDEWVDAAYTTRIKGDPVAGLGTVSSASRVYYASVSQVNAYANCAPMLTAPNNMEAAKIELSSAGPGVPVFHLPYNDNQNIRMTLVDKQGIGNVNFFLTEFIDGCLVYVQGSRTNPSVSHLNAKETLRRQDWTQYFWSDASKKQAA